MPFITSSAKPTEKVSSDSAWLSFDLLSNLTYMAAVAASFASRDRILELSISQPFKTAIYFKQAYLLAKRLGFEYSRAFQLVGKKAGAETVKALLLRFASAIDSGESELDFLVNESRVEKEIYTASYLRQLDTLQKWTDAYAALIVSASVIVVVVLVSSMLYNLGEAFLVVLSGMTILMTFFGGFVIYKTSPYEVKCYKKGKGPLKRRLALRLFFWGAPLGILGATYAAVNFGVAPAFLVLGAALVPSGLFAFLDDGMVTKIDQDVASFVRALSRVASALGTTVSVALTRLDRRSMGTLEPYIQRLQTRLQSNLDPALCWERFRDETGSELLNRCTRMLLDGCSLGGSPERVGEIASDYGLSISILRAKRGVASSTFAFLTIPLHFALVSLMIFILEVMKGFQGHLSSVMVEMAGKSFEGRAIQLSALPMFQQRDLTLVSLLTLVVIIGFTVANSVTPWFATGGHPAKIVFYASLMCLLSGVSLLIIPPVAQMVLQR